MMSLLDDELEAHGGGYRYSRKFSTIDQQSPQPSTTVQLVRRREQAGAGVERKSKLESKLTKKLRRASTKPIEWRTRFYKFSIRWLIFCFHFEEQEKIDLLKKLRTLKLEQNSITAV